MTFKNIEYFLAVVEAMSISKAAEKLYVSQQSLSEVINRIEKEYGVALFNRGSPLTLTYAGEKLKSAATDILRLKRNIDSELGDISNNTRSRINLGITPGRGKIWMPNFLVKFKELFPLIEVNVILGSPDYLEAQLLIGAVDIIVGHSGFSSIEISSIDLITEKICLIVPDRILKDLCANHYPEKLMEFQSGVSITDFADCPFLVTKLPHHMRRLFDQQFKKYGLSPDIVMEGADCEFMFWLCMQGLGITFWAETLVFPRIRQLAPELKSLVHAFPLADSDARSEIAVGHHRGHRLPKVTRTLIEQLKNYCHSFTASGYYGDMESSVPLVPQDGRRSPLNAQQQSR